MTKMSKAQRTAILDFHNGVTAKRHTMIANERTIAALVRNGWAIATSARYRTAYVTRAGLLAAGVDLNAIHGEALSINRLRGATAGMALMVAYERRRLIAGGFRRVDEMAWNNVVSRLHAEALRENTEWNDAHSASYWERATDGMSRVSAF